VTETPLERPWLQHYEDGVPHTLSYPTMPLHGFLDESARKHPGSAAILFGGVVGKRLIDGAMTYGELSTLADRFASGLQSLGVRKGDRVAIMLPNCPQFVIAFYGALRAGAVVVPTNPLYTAEELRHQLDDSGAETLVVLSRLYPVAKSVVPQTAVKHAIVTNIKEYFPPALRALFTLAREKKEGHRVSLDGEGRALWFQDLLRRGSSAHPVQVQPSDLAVLQYTGGTTGVPKAAMLSHRALVANTLQAKSWFATLRNGQASGMAVMPFFHVYGLTAVLNLGVATASTLILVPRFDLHHVLLAVQKHKPKMFAGAPRIYVAINNSPETKKFDLRSIEACVSGSAPLPIEVAERFEQITGGGKVVEGYGLTEAAPITHVNPIHGKRKVGSVGIPLPDIDSKIVDLDTGTRDLGVGEIGEVIVRGPNLMDGYYKRPEETALVLRDGWLYTGDIGKMDEDGYFSIVDRKKEMIIVSGYKVYPRDVEEVLYRHPAVLEAAVIGVPHPERGECVKAFVATKTGTSATESDIIEHCAKSLARFKVPVAVEFRPELPKTLIGKVLRRQLAEEEKARRAS
jgi:long-chain acyl-CoA synthetase